MDKRLRLLNNLQCFEVAARLQSYSRAAEQLFISQAAVSQQMRHLEQSLATQLFVRRGRHMLLTQHGEILYQACKKGFNEIVCGLNDIQQQGIAGDLTITSTQAFCALWIMPRLYQFSQCHPQINVQVMGSNLIEDLQQKRIDLAIRFSSSSDTFSHEGMVIEPIGRDVLLPVCSPSLLEKVVIQQPADLLKCHLVSLADDCTVSWDGWFKLVEVDGYQSHPMKTVVTSTDLALSAVLSGHGAMLASSGLIDPYVKSGQLVIPFNIELSPHWNTYLVYLSNNPKQARIKLFCDWVRAELKLAQPEGQIKS